MTDLGQQDVYTMPLPDWGCDVTVIRQSDGGIYYPIRTLCAVLGIAHQPQIRRLQEHRVLQRLVKQCPLPTARGIRDTWCIERRGIGFWLGGIQVLSVRSEVQPRLIEFQEALVSAADRLLFGDVESDPVRFRLMGIDSQVADVRRFTLALEKRIGHLEDVVLLPTDDS